MRNNIIMLQDSYKLSHFDQYPDGTNLVHSYLESRGGEYDQIVFFGLQYILKEYMSRPITREDIEEAAEFSALHGEPFNRAGWQYIMDNHNGYLPVNIKAVPEGMILSPHTALMTIENTDPKCFWLTSVLETLLLKVWYPTTIATKSLYVKNIIQRYHELTMDDLSGVAYAYHNFGDRGSSSVESAGIGGVAHLTQFMGTDNFNSLKFAREYYNEKIAGHSIKASEHSTVTSWGKDHEFEMIADYLEKSIGLSMIAGVLDSFNIFNAVDFVTSKLKTKIESDEYPIFVIRPDSGDPVTVITDILKIIDKNNVKYTVTTKGYKLFSKYRIIWGDGVTPEVIDIILETVTALGYAAGNIAFGSGGDIMQNITRDTCKFAFKCSMIEVGGNERDVFKSPITDPGKVSKKGRQNTDLMLVVYENGKLFNTSTLEEVRKRSEII